MSHLLLTCLTHVVAQNQKPVFVANAAVDAQEVFQRADELRAVELRRRARSAVQSIHRLCHRSEALSRGALFRSLVEPRAVGEDLACNRYERDACCLQGAKSV